MIDQTLFAIGNKQILVMLFTGHLSMVEITQVTIGGYNVAFDPCQLVHIVPDDDINNYQDFDNPEVIDSLKAMARAIYYYGAN